MIKKSGEVQNILFFFWLGIMSFMLALIISMTSFVTNINGQISNVSDSGGVSENSTKCLGLFQPTYEPANELVREDVSMTYAVDIMAHAIYAEAGVDGKDGMTATAEVIKNRMNNPNYPESVQDVVYQKVNNVWQFSIIPNGTFLQTPSDLAYEIAREVLNPDYMNVMIPNNVIFFSASGCNSWASRTREFYSKIGTQNFYYEYAKGETIYGEDI